ncbi:hypothetical protein FACS1894127_7710 [Clostridia bacterium]|nr:hypothetical protein FACS1894127_7710 [Clostridia bacterium]
MKTSTQLKALVRNLSREKGVEAEIIECILRVPVDDGVLFTFRKIEEIREEADYPGYRISIDAVLDKTRQTMHIDITTGDFVTPREIEYSFKLMFEERSISILAYNLETVLAEKFESIISRGLTNTRMRNFYDIYILTNTQQFYPATFHMALEKTTAKRKTTEQVSDAQNCFRTYLSIVVTASRQFAYHTLHARRQG